MFLASACARGHTLTGAVELQAPALLRRRGRDGKRLARRDATIARVAALLEPADPRSRG